MSPVVNMIKIKTPQEIEKIHAGGKLLAQILRQVALAAKPGVVLNELDHLAEKLIIESGAQPSFKGYCARFSDRPFPATLCASVNEEVVHAPADRKHRLKDGDVVGLDLGLRFLGFYTDHAVTVPVGKISKQAKELIKVTEASMYLGIEQIKPGKFIHDISRTVQNYVESKGYSVVRDLVGHGVGYEIHEEPRIPNYIPKGGPREVIEIKQGMVLAIEPMVNAGSWQVKTLEDGWTVVTVDGSWAAHFEHTVAVTENGCEILTQI